MSLPTWSDADVIKQLSSGTYWSSSVITYAFPTQASSINAPSSEAPGFRALTAAEQSLAAIALQSWDDLIAPVFGITTVSTSNIEFGYSSSASGYAHTYFPFSGSIWFSSKYPDLTNPAVGSYGFSAYVHEIGHALGLEHMGNYNGTGNWTPSSYQDSTVLSVMSYFGPNLNSGQSLVAWADWVSADGVLYSPQTPMVNDVLAIQTIYGVDQTTRIGNTTYGFNTKGLATNSQVFDFTQNKNPIVTIYDAEGTDTLDLSGWNSTSTIDLHPGAYSSANAMTNNIGIAKSCSIENAISGEGNDTLTGNDASNILSAGAGNDTLYATAGLDTLNGGSGLDSAVFSNAYSRYLYQNNGANLCVVDPSASNNNQTLLVDIEQIAFAGKQFVIENRTTTTATTTAIRALTADCAFGSTTTGTCVVINAAQSGTINLYKDAYRFALTDGYVALDYEAGGHAGQAYRLYKGVLGRDGEAAGLGYVINRLDQGESLRNVSSGYLNSPEYQIKFGNTDQSTFINLLYKNILGRSADQSGMNFITQWMTNGATREDVTLGFTESPEYIAQCIQLIGNHGIGYTTVTG